jgi:serine protease Do
VTTFRWLAIALLTAAPLVAPALALDSVQGSFAQVVADVQPKIVKIYGAGGIRGLEPYQSGFLISGEGHVLTAWSYVLDTDELRVTLNDGRRYEAALIGADPRLELAVLKIDASDTPHFTLSDATDAELGQRTLAFSNLFGVAAGDEPVSVQHGIVSVRTQLDARRGVFETPYRGPVYVLDAMTNNPGAAGGALTTLDGRLVAMLGKELRNSLTDTWLNYAIPTDQIAPSVEAILSGVVPNREDNDRAAAEQADLEKFGIVLVPDVLERTPPYIDAVHPGSAAAKAGLKADDLVLFVGEQVVHSSQSLREEAARLARDGELNLVVMRDQELFNVVVRMEPATNSEDE